MQFVYAFLFLIYLTFLPSNAGWAVSLLWGMMILPLGDALQNTMQNLVSRVAGINNEELANRGIGIGAAMSNTVKSLVYQFKVNNEREIETQPNILSRIINKVNNVESEQVKSTSYENYSKNIMEDQNNVSITKPINQSGDTINNSNNINNAIKNEIKEENNISGVKKAFNVGKEFMNLGMYMAERKKFQK